MGGEPAGEIEDVGEVEVVGDLREGPVGFAEDGLGHGEAFLGPVLFDGESGLGFEATGELAAA